MNTHHEAPAPNHPTARPKGLGPDGLAQIILDSIDDDEPPTELYTLSVHEARMLAHAVLNVVQADARVGCVSDEAEIAASEAYAQGVGERPFSQRMRAAIIAVLPHLTANDLRDTPAGQALIREGIAAARTTVPALLDALEKVLRLHPRVVVLHADPEFGRMEDDAICGACIVNHEPADWPCPTVEAITTALNGDAA